MYIPRAEEINGGELHHPAHFLVRNAASAVEDKLLSHRW